MDDNVLLACCVSRSDYEIAVANTTWPRNSIAFTVLAIAPLLVVFWTPWAGATMAATGALCLFFQWRASRLLARVREVERAHMARLERARVVMESFAILHHPWLAEKDRSMLMQRAVDRACFALTYRSNDELTPARFGELACTAFQALIADEYPRGRKDQRGGRSNVVSFRTRTNFLTGSSRL